MIPSMNSRAVGPAAGPTQTRYHVDSNGISDFSLLQNLARHRKLKKYLVGL
jgi:hypothetical protein